MLAMATPMNADQMNIGTNIIGTPKSMYDSAA